MDFEYDEKTEQLRAKLLAFMDEFVYPAEKVFTAQLAELVAHRHPRAVLLGEHQLDVRSLKHRDQQAAEVDPR